MSQQREAMRTDIGAMIDGKLGNDAAVRILSRTDEDHVTAEQIAGAVDAVMERCTPFPTHADAIDCCGTGGDYQHIYNISTATALVLAACGVKVAKHGNRSITSRSGSADVLEALGVHTMISPEKSAAILDEIGIAFLYAPAFHAGFARLAPMRKDIGHRTILNVIGPLCNPARVDYQLIGVYSPSLLEPVAQAALMLGRKHIMVVHGDDGCDEISITGPTQAVQVIDGNISRMTIEPRRAGLPTHAIKDLKGGDAAENAEAMLAILDGEENAYADAVIFNAGVALFVAGKVAALRGGATLARDAIATGEAKRVLNRLIEASTRP